MPVLSFFYRNELNETAQFIGSCDFARKEEFEARIDKLCEVMNWQRCNIKCVHHYMNSIVDQFPML